MRLHSPFCEIVLFRFQSQSCAAANAVGTDAIIVFVFVALPQCFLGQKHPDDQIDDLCELPRKRIGSKSRNNVPLLFYKGQTIVVVDA